MPSFTRSGESIWKGSGPDGKGHLTTQSGVVSNVPYGAKMRFGDEKGTNPEELLAIAHSGCFNMALAFGLTKAGKDPDELRTTAKVTIETDGDGFSIKKIRLELKGKVPGMSAEDFKKAAEGAKAGCPVSKLFKGAEITLDAELLN
jgi:osmotically inducible protein OsmC